jgi:phosphohistidine phosphatase
MRHGKAEPFGAEDHRRRLIDRGRRDATAAGRWLAAQDMVPTHAFVSSAQRARSTWEALAKGSASAAEARIEDAVYTAGADSAVDLLSTAPADARTVIYVGHNPATASLAYLLDDGDPEPDAFRAMSAGFATAAMAVLEVTVPWVDLGAATGHLVAFHVGKG